MPPRLYACGSNGAGQLSLHHSEDVSTLTPCIFHPSLDPLWSTTRSISIINLVSAATHALLLLRCDHTNVLLGAGTNKLGQLGPKCALREDERVEGRFKKVDFGMGDEWEVAAVATTWTTSFVVCQRKIQQQSGSGGIVGSGELGGSGGPASSGLDASDVEQIVVSCGSNDFGELGRAATPSNDTVAVTRPSDECTVVDVGLQKGETVEMIRGGQRHVVVVIQGRRGQRVVGWGAARKGELDPLSGTGSSKTGSSMPNMGNTSGPSSNGKRRAMGKGKAKARTYPTTLPPTPLKLDMPPDTTIVDIGLGAAHTLVLLSNGSVLGWGSDAKGQITDIRAMNDVIRIGAMWGGSFFQCPSGIYSQGSDTHGQLCRGAGAGAIERGIVQMDEGDEAADGDVRKMVLGSEHVVVVDREMWVGGWNEHGNLGLGDPVDRSRLTRVSGIDGVRGVWCGLAATWVWMHA